MATAPQRTCLPVSVIVPAYNAAATLPRAVASIDAQTCLPAEIILIDDASDDDTWRIIEQLCARQGGLPIKAARLPRNNGPADARNAGWDMANQEYVSFLDADDAWHPRKLEVQYRWLADHPDVMLCGHRCVVRSLETPAPDIPDKPPAVRYYGVTNFLIGNRLSTPSVMLRRHLTERFEAGKHHSEDFLLWVQIVARHGQAAFIDLPLAFLFKPRYGAAGLSGDLWRMYRGELDSYAQLRRDGVISLPAWLLVVVWSWIKFLYRFIGGLSQTPRGAQSDER